MKIDPKSMESRYQVAERLVWQNLADWKKQAIIEDRTLIGKKNSHILDEFAKEVIMMAESEHFFASASAVIPSLTADLVEKN